MNSPKEECRDTGLCECFEEGRESGTPISGCTDRLRSALLKIERVPPG